MGEADKLVETTQLDSPRRRFRRFIDTVARVLVKGSGVAVVAAVAGIIVVIVVEFWPLFRSGEFIQKSPTRRPPGADVLFVGSSEGGEYTFTIAADGGVSFFRGAVLARQDNILTDHNSRLTHVAEASNGRFALLSSEHKVYRIHVVFERLLQANDWQVTGRVKLEQEIPLQANSENEKILAVAYAANSDNWTFLAALSSAEVLLLTTKPYQSLLNENRAEPVRFSFKPKVRGEIRAVSLSPSMQSLLIGTAAGELMYLRRGIDGTYEREHLVFVTPSVKKGVRALLHLLGERQLVVTDEEGDAATLLLPSTDERERGLAYHTNFSLRGAEGTALAASARNRVFVIGTSKGQLIAYTATTGELVAKVAASESAIHRLSFSPKGDAVLFVDAEGRISRWQLEAPHPEATLWSLFGKPRYEGYPDGAFVWQSSGATDAFEPKLSMVPLLFGTLKATMFAMFFAVPLAVFSALYVSQFLSRTIRGYVKPVVELMAGIPSVVVGFFAGLWLAPRVEDFVLGVFLFLFALPVFAFIFGIVSRMIGGPASLLRSSRISFYAILGCTALSLFFSLYVGEYIEQIFFSGEFSHWIQSELNWTYAQRNSLVVGIAMGFAVIPIIFTISEDSLSSVHPSLHAASFALGANKWQTAIRVVLPAASSGVFSAVMIGFGRAIGETMIVLMATGNTPLMDFSPFTGFRALSANIAVELPEAPHGATLYRVLFLSAFLLFLLTLVVNSLSELVRLHLRRRYQL